MLRISLAALAIYFSTISAFFQSLQDSSSYKSRKLKVEEVNFVSSYYKQDGNNSAVTGGIGTEKLTDFATTIDVKLSRYDSRNRKHTSPGRWELLYTLQHHLIILIQTPFRLPRQETIASILR